MTTRDRERFLPSNRWRRLLAVALVMYAALSLAWTVYATFTGPRAGTDLHSYWFAGHLIREGTNPYRGSFLQNEPELPVQYLDGPQGTPGAIRQPTLTTRQLTRGQ